MCDLLLWFLSGFFSFLFMIFFCRFLLFPWFWNPLGFSNSFRISCHSVWPPKIFISSSLKLKLFLLYSYWVPWWPLSKNARIHLKPCEFLIFTRTILARLQSMLSASFNTKKPGFLGICLSAVLSCLLDSSLENQETRRDCFTRARVPVAAPKSSSVQEKQEGIEL